MREDDKEEVKRGGEKDTYINFWSHAVFKKIFAALLIFEHSWGFSKL